MAILSSITPAQQPGSKGGEPILEYMKRTWAVLTRSNQTLATSAVDPKFQPEPGGRWPVYISASEDYARIEAQLRREVAPNDLRLIDLHSLSPSRTPTAGLLYLPLPYVVPGGRFNELYGWDSYFIVRGLLRDGLVAQARDVVDDLLYEIRNYGKILNANRAYYLTRSQPPFLTGMILAVYRRAHNRQWIEDAVPAIEAYYRYWTEEPHLTRATGLARYFDLGDGPAPEVIASERDPSGVTHYDRVLKYFRTHEKVGDYDISQYFDAKANQLTPMFYKGDRSMRESGFDPSGRFGPFSVDIIHYNPVCLNSLLYLMESETAELLQDIPARAGEAAIWRNRAKERAALINKLMWNERDGLYEDYDFVSGRMRRYPFLTTFYPLWSGIASQEQAARVAASLPLFERAGGLQTSTTESGDQWDAPFGWAPLELIAAEGLRRYGYNAEADRISEKFLSMVAEEYRRTGRIMEKYDVVRRSVELNREIRFGYHSNEAGFGWTNAVFTNLLDALPPEQRKRILTTPE